MPEREIAYCHACGAKMDVSAVEPFTNVACPTCGKHTRVKREFGSYTLMRRHAIGGMSMVFIARDNTLSREVVVKILSQEYSADEKRIGAFEEEARITASISHPNVVRVFTTGRAFERFYIAMEFVTGGHLEHHIKERGTIPEGEALGLAIEVAEGLKAAHHAGLIHRDIKPGNILLDAAGSAKIVDFGLALVTQGGKAKASEIWATPYYVPPETIEGSEEDFRADVYAFGASFYHAMAGKPPCNEESMDTRRLRQAKREVKPLAKVAAWLGAETCAVIDRCMALQPTDRYRSYGDLIGALKSAREMALSGPPPPEKTAAPTPGRSRRKSGGGQKLALAGASLAVVAALVFALKAILGGEEEPKKVVSVTEPSGGGTVDAGGGTPEVVQVARIYKEAGEALRAGDYAKALQRFAEVRDDPDAMEPTASWAACEAVAMAYLDGDAERARQEISKAREHVGGAMLLQAGRRKRLGEGLEALSGWEPAEWPDRGDESPEAHLLGLLGALKNWESGMPDRAEPLFKRVAEASPQGGLSWIAPYQSLAGNYLSDLATLRAAEPKSFDLPPASCRELIDELHGIHASLKTKGRARFNIRCWQLELEREARRPAATPEPEPDRTGLDALFADCRFVEALDLLREEKPDEEDEQAVWAAKVLLAESALAFLAELAEQVETAPGAGPVADREGGRYPAVTGGDSEGLEVEDAGGEKRKLAWEKLDPESLIELHRSLVKDSSAELEKFRRHEQAVAFGLLAGDAERARSAGAKLAELSDAFRERWARMLPGLPR